MRKQRSTEKGNCLTLPEVLAFIENANKTQLRAIVIAFNIRADLILRGYYNYKRSFCILKEKNRSITLLQVLVFIEHAAKSHLNFFSNSIDNNKRFIVVYKKRIEWQMKNFERYINKNQKGIRA